MSEPSSLLLSNVQITVPMKFNGSSAVLVRNPSNLADLAAYTSLKLYITLPDAARARRAEDATSQFVFYLGNKDVSNKTQSLVCIIFHHLNVSNISEFIAHYSVFQIILQIIFYFDFFKEVFIFEKVIVPHYYTQQSSTTFDRSYRPKSGHLLNLLH